MLAISTGLAGLDGVGIISQSMGHIGWFGESRGYNKYQEAFPDWLVVNDRTILRGHYVGSSSFYQADVIRAWLTPILAWTLFISLLMLTAHCINVLVRRQWADRERLTFPIVWLPMEMTEGGTGTSFFRNRLMWMGFGLSFSLCLWNGIAFLYPSLPAINVGVQDLKPLISTKPWNAVDWFPITFYPLAVGLGYLLPLDLLFSCIFFFFFWKMQMVASNAMAWDITPDFPFIKEQGFGSVLGLFVFYLWTGRKHYLRILRGEREEEIKGLDRPKEALSERAALVGALLGLVGLLLFCMAAKVAWWVSLAFFALFIPTIIIVSRIRAELGAPVHDFHFIGPDAMLPRTLGVSSFRQNDMAFFTFAFSLTRAHRSDTMPVGLEALQMARMRNLDARRMFIAIMLATVLGTLSVFWAFEHQAYIYGAAAKFNQGSGHADQAFDRMGKWTGGVLDMKPNIPATTAMGVGLLTSLALLMARLRWFGFPLHPLGYAISSSWSINITWMPLLIAWVLKGLTMHYGGLRAYRMFLPFFLGLILGDCVMGSVWAVLSFALNMRTYNFFGA
jgi:hypothetical protein